MTKRQSEEKDVRDRVQDIEPYKSYPQVRVQRWLFSPQSQGSGRENVTLVLVPHPTSDIPS